MMIVPIKILLIEDEPLWQQGIETLLTTVGDAFQLVGVADCYQQGLALFKDLKPDVVLLDWKLIDEPDGLALGQAIEALGFPADRIILVSGSDPTSIPPHPYHFVPKPDIASLLISTLKTILI